MNYEFEKIQQSLKTLMKTRKATYESMAKTLGVSPATIKRRLNGEDMTLQHLKEFAEALSISFYELIELSKNVKREAHLFTEAQEKLLASELWVMMTFRLIVAGQSFSQIQSQLKISEKDLRKLAKDFEKVGLAQLNAKDRIKALVHFPFKWRPQGTLMKAYDELLLQNIVGRIKGDTGEAGLSKRFEFALSPEAYKGFCKELESVHQKYSALSEIHLSSKVDMNHLVSGLIYLGPFSIWDSNQSF